MSGRSTRSVSVHKTPSLKADSLAFALLHSAGLVAAVRAGQSLTDAHAALLARHAEWMAATRSAIRDLTWTTLRAYGRTDPVLDALLSKQLPGEVDALLRVALIRLMRRPDAAYVTVDQAVRAAAVIAPRFKGLVNAVLRNYLRQRDDFERRLRDNEQAYYAHPAWWLDRLRVDHPRRWQEIANAGNTYPPMSLRINRRHPDAENALRLLEDEGLTYRRLANGAVLLDAPVPVARVPGFDRGLFSVQDAGAQWAALWLEPPQGARVLDACAAPGGKTAHLLELADVRLLALDADRTRLGVVRENLNRLGLVASTRAVDARRTEQWWDGRAFDCILADVPCSGSGVVRRHPDIKWLRRQSDIAGFARQQREILDALWQTLIPGGKMLYATCSVFRQENEDQICDFCRRHPQAEQQPLDGHLYQQLLPGPEHDGFFYALVRKRV